MGDSKLLPLFASITIIQTLVIAYLFVEIRTLNQNFAKSSVIAKTLDTTDELQEDYLDASSENESSSFQNNASEYTQNASALDTKSVREIFRQELARHHQQNDKAPAQTISKKASNPDIIDQTNEQFEVYVSQGEISHNSMEKFQTNIARLAPQDQKKMLRQLAQAINSGQIKITNH